MGNLILRQLLRFAKIVSPHRMQPNNNVSTLLVRICEVGYDEYFQHPLVERTVRLKKGHEMQVGYGLYVFLKPKRLIQQPMGYF